jgi:pyruvate kinase
MMKVHLVGHILISGTGITTKTACANLCVCKDEGEVKLKFNEGDIIVIPFTTNALLPYIKKSSGIITEQSGLNSHAAICGLSLDLPVIVGADSATKILKSGATVTLDATRGIVIYN